MDLGFSERERNLRPVRRAAVGLALRLYAIAPLVAVFLVAASPGAGALARVHGSSLRRIHQIRQLTPEQLAKTPAVHVRGVVTYYDSIVPNLFIEDATAGIWVDLRGSRDVRLQPGEVLDVRGVAQEGFSPYIAHPRWKIVGHARLPEPRRLMYDQAATGSWDADWVRIDGVVRSFVEEAAGNVLVIDVATPTGAFKVRIPNYEAKFPMHLVDATVQFRGVLGATFNRLNELVEIHLMMPSMADAKVLKPAPKHPFSVAVTPISMIRRFSSDLPDMHRVLVRGIVTARFAGKGLYLMDSTGGVYAESQDGTPVKAGDAVEVLGFPAAGDFSPVLMSSTIRAMHHHIALAPVRITGKQALQGAYDAQLVNLAGRVESVRNWAGTTSLLMESNDHVPFVAVLAGGGMKRSQALVGATLDLTGICTVKTDSNGNPSDFQIVLRSPKDVRVVSGPPWLTARRAGLVILAVVATAGMILIWVVILRRRLHKQTRIIRLKLKNEMALEEKYRRVFERNLTGLYIADPDGTILDCNDACAVILGFPNRQELLDHRAEAERITSDLHGAVQPDAIVSAERRFQRRDGSWAWSLNSARLIPQNGHGPAVMEGALVDITDLKEAQERIQVLAYYDSLTGLPNRTLLMDRLRKGVSSAKRHKEKLALLFLDLDRFKTINDSLGHSCGDELLLEMGRRLQATVRDQDTVARLGGDEFLVVLGAVEDDSDAAIAAERIARETNREFYIQGQALSVTCSIGVSMFPDHGEDVETLIKSADAAMYSAKEAGGNTFRFFTAEMTERAVDRLMLESSLRVALDRNEFFLVYQPQVDLETGEIICWEALLRWQHPQLGLVSPDRFIRIAESSGMMIPIGEWVLRTACMEATKWGVKGPAVAVNVSAVQFRQEEFSEVVLRALRETGLAPERLELEMTESMLMSSEDVTFRMLDELRSLGVRVAIDDFGTGYSSLSYLRQFRVNKLKIDRGFIQNVAANGDDEAITAAIIQMAKCLSLRVTAEGVEHEDQLNLLRECGCDEVQGFLYSRPVRADEIGEISSRILMVRGDSAFETLISANAPGRRDGNSNGAATFASTCR